jgi:hypothetical protein
MEINIREYRRGDRKWIIQRNWQHSVHKTKKNTTHLCVGDHYTQLNINNVNSN